MSRSAVIDNFMYNWSWHTETKNYDHSLAYYAGDGSETLNL